VSASRPFEDRASAGRLLAERLAYLKDADPLVLALPRGGVPVAYEIAKSLDADLDLLMVRKLGAPGHEEFAIGAVVDGEEPQWVPNEDAMRIFHPSREYVQRELGRQMAELQRRRRAYVGKKRKPPLAGRTVVIVDDGIATGSTVIAALRGVRRKDPKSLIVATPVAPRDTIEKLRPLCDEIVVLASPVPFNAVGQHYRDFNQVGDRQVIELLEDAGSQPATDGR
jgi:putative phosphoribosyl transferase